MTEAIPDDLARELRALNDLELGALLHGLGVEPFLPSAASETLRRLASEPREVTLRTAARGAIAKLPDRGRLTGIGGVDTARQTFGTLAALGARVRSTLPDPDLRAVRASAEAEVAERAKAEEAAEWRDREAALKEQAERQESALAAVQGIAARDLGMSNRKIELLEGRVRALDHEVCKAKDALREAQLRGGQAAERSAEALGEWQSLAVEVAGACACAEALTHAEPLKSKALAQKVRDAFAHEKKGRDQAWDNANRAALAEGQALRNLRAACAAEDALIAVGRALGSKASGTWPELGRAFSAEIGKLKAELEDLRMRAAGFPGKGHWRALAHLAGLPELAEGASSQAEPVGPDARVRVVDALERKLAASGPTTINVSGAPAELLAAVAKVDELRREVKRRGELLEGWRAAAPVGCRDAGALRDLVARLEGFLGRAGSAGLLEGARLLADELGAWTSLARELLQGGEAEATGGLRAALRSLVETMLDAEDCESAEREAVCRALGQPESADLAAAAASLRDAVGDLGGLSGPGALREAILRQRDLGEVSLRLLGAIGCRLGFEPGAQVTAAEILAKVEALRLGVPSLPPGCALVLKEHLEALRKCAGVAEGASPESILAWAGKESLEAVNAAKALAAANAEIRRILRTPEHKEWREHAQEVRDQADAHAGGLDLLAPLRAAGVLATGPCDKAEPRRVIELALERVSADKREIARLRAANGEQARHLHGCADARDALVGRLGWALRPTPCHAAIFEHATEALDALPRLRAEAATAEQLAAEVRRRGERCAELEDRLRKVGDLAGQIGDFVAHGVDPMARPASRP